MLSAKAKYGLKAMVYLAEHETDGNVSVAEIAERQNIPKKFLDTILLELKNNGLVHSRKGKFGGYMLARSGMKVTVGQIVRILDGPLALVSCASQTAYARCIDCADENACQIRRIMKQIRDSTAAIMDNTSLRDLLPNSGLSMIMNYDI